MKKTILFLDANKRATLSIIRSIGKRKEYNIICAGKSKLDLCRFSNVTEKYFIYKDPEKNYHVFIESLKLLMGEIKPDYIFPCSDVTLYSIYSSAYYEEIKEKLIAPDKKVYMESFDKKHMNHLAAQCKVRIIEEVSSSALTFPVVIKPRQSRNLVNNKIIFGFREFAYNEAEFINGLKKISHHDQMPLIQKKIQGNGYGLFAATKEGKIFASFAHERIREFPPDGGVSTLRRSKEIHPSLLDASTKIIQRLNWTGIIMVEFKGETEESADFMEVNGRPWGSMDLAVASGVDFPNIMIDIFINKLSYEQLYNKYNKTYIIGCYSQWIVGEIKHVRYLMQLKQPFRNCIKALCQILKKHPNVTYDTFRADDPWPFLFELLSIFNNKISFIKNKMAARLGRLTRSRVP